MTTNYQTGDQSTEHITERLRQDLGNKAREASRQFADKSKEKAEALSGKAADALDDVEATVDAEADVLEQRGWEDLSHYMREMADGIGGLSENLRHKSVDELIRSAADLAQRNTALFVLGSVAIGFGLSRFVKAGAHDSSSRMAGAARGEGNTWRAGSSDEDGSYAYPAGERTVSDPMTSDEYRPHESH